MILIRGIKFKKIDGIALWPFVLVRSKKPINKLIWHERIHLRQQLELLIFPFYIWYVLEWLYRCLQFRNFSKAYYEISFEKEAYTHESDPDYLKNRKFWSFIHYL